MCISSKLPFQDYPSTVFARSLHHLLGPEENTQEKKMSLFLDPRVVLPILEKAALCFACLPSDLHPPAHPFIIRACSSKSYTSYYQMYVSAICYHVRLGREVFGHSVFRAFLSRCYEATSGTTFICPTVELPLGTPPSERSCLNPSSKSVTSG